MTILRSPGCNCSCECLLIEVPDYNQSILADTLHAIPHNIPVNCVADLTKLLPKDYFRDENNIFKVHIKDTSGTTTHKTLTYQPKRYNTSFYEIDEREWNEVPYYGKTSTVSSTLDVYDGSRAYKRYLEVNDGTDNYETLGLLKRMYVGDKLYRIKSVTAGTFNPTEGVAYSKINKADIPESACNPGEEYQGIIEFDKTRYVFLDTDTNQEFGLIRYQNTSACDDLKTKAYFDFGGGIEFATWNGGDTNKTLTFSHDMTTKSSGTVRYSGYEVPAGCTDTVFWFYSSQVLSLPTTSVTGDGHFEIESYKINGIAGQSTTVKVYRTGGNSTAVDVVVAVGNADVTLNFSAGDIVKTFTITHDAHDGATFTSAMVPTNDAIVIRDRDYPIELTFRSSTFEFGHVANSFSILPIRKHGGYEVWDDKIPFERDGWGSSSVKIYVESNVDVTLESYKLYEIKHEAHCNLSLDNADCPVYDSCSAVAEYHSQQFDIEVDLGVPAANMPPLLYTLNSGCSSTHVFSNEALPRQAVSKRLGGVNTSIIFLDSEWRYQNYYGPSGEFNVSFNILINELAESNRLVRCYDDAYWDAQETSFTITLPCGDFDDSTDFSNMPRACAAFGSIGYCYTITCGDSYTNGTITGSGYPVGDLPDFEQEKHEYATSCYTITECSSASLISDDGIKSVSAKATAVRLTQHQFLSLGPFDEPSGIAAFRGDRVEVFTYADKDVWTTVWEWDAGWTFVGQRFPYDYVYGTAGVLTPSEIATEVDFLVSGGADFWFEYTNAPDVNDNGFYRVTSPSTLSGPFATADDGSGNVFSDVTQEVGITAEVTVEYFKSYLNTDVGTNPCLADTTFRCPLDGYTQTESLGVNTFSGTFLLSSNYYKDVEYAICEEPTATRQIKIDGLMPEMYRDFGFTETTIATTTQTLGTTKENETTLSYRVNEFTEGSLSVSWPVAPHYSSCEPVASITSLSVEPPCPEVEDGFALKLVDGSNQPTEVSGTCTSTTNSANDICCDGGLPVEEIVDYIYWDYDLLPDWNGEVHITGVGRKESLTFFYSTVMVPEGFGQSKMGLTTLTLQSDTWKFPAKWGDCYTGLDARQEDFDGYLDNPSGPEKIYFFKSINKSGSTPYFAQLSGTADDDPWSMVMDIESEAIVLNKDDITMTAKAYSPTWQKF